MSTTRLIATTGMAWLTSLAFTVGVLLGIHRALAKDEAGTVAAARRSYAALASATPGPAQRRSGR